VAIYFYYLHHISYPFFSVLLRSEEKHFHGLHSSCLPFRLLITFRYIEMIRIFLYKFIKVVLNISLMILVRSSTELY